MLNPYDFFFTVKTKPTLGILNHLILIPTSLVKCINGYNFVE
ncbi:hypothetical protein NIES4075_61920 [Tolypothrix sp. NIES-4075]|nr:hypothetical protein NIES4075_61920 [Tolypothrix sp. NIES-4075]